MAADYTSLGLDAQMFNAPPMGVQAQQSNADILTSMPDNSIPASKIEGLPADQLSGGEFSADKPIIIKDNGFRAIYIGKLPG